LVSKHQSNGGKSFIFVNSGLVYPFGDFLMVTNDELDFHQLEHEKLITLSQNGSGQLWGKPTELGIATARSTLSGSENGHKSESPDTPDSPKFRMTPDEPLGPNPFPRGEPRHEAFLEVSKWAKQKLALFNAKALATMPSEDAEPERWQAWRVDAVAGQFSLKTTAILGALGTNAENLEICERIIDRFAEQILMMAEKTFAGRGGSVATFISELRIKMLQYREYSVGQAYRLLSTTNREAVPKTNGTGTSQPSAPSQFEIEKYADEIFSAGLGDRIDKYAKDQAQALAEARSRNNVGAYLPALIKCKQQSLRSQILAKADALVEAGTIYEVPLGEWAYKALEKDAVLMTAGTNSTLRGELDLHAARTRIARSNKGGEREIHRAMTAALGEAKLKLKTQRIKAERSLRNVPASGLQSGTKPAKNYKTALARNIDRLRKECGWSFDDLARATELDKKLVLGHVNGGKGTHPKTLERYAQTFAEKLARPVTVAELES
jgi:hypothetical protein